MINFMFSLARLLAKWTVAENGADELNVSIETDAKTCNFQLVKLKQHVTADMKNCK